MDQTKPCFLRHGICPPRSNGFDFFPYDLCLLLNVPILCLLPPPPEVAICRTRVLLLGKHTAGPWMLVVGALVGSSISVLEAEGAKWQFLLTVLEELEGGGLLVSFLPGLPLL